METSRKGYFEMLEDLAEFKAFKNIEEILYKEHGIKVSSSNKIDAFKEIVNICLDTKIGVNLSESNYSVLLHFVLNKLDRGTFRSLLKKITSSNNNVLNNIIVYNDVKHPLLHLLLDDGKYNLVQDLLEFGADVNLKDLRQETLLFYAIRSKEYEVIEMITKAGCDVNVRDKEGLLAINYIFNIRIWESDKSKKKIPYIEIINLLCSHGNNLDFNNEGGSRMLYDACKLGLFNEVQFLLKFGANMFFVSSNGDTMLHAATQGHNLKLVEFLLNNGLNINAKNIYNKTPLSKLISNYYGCGDPSSERLRRDVDIIEFLADNGADINTFTNDFRTPLEESILFNVPEIMECLLELNAYINVLKDFINGAYKNIFGERSLYEAKKIHVDELLIVFLSTKVHIFDYINKTKLERFEWMLSLHEKCKLEMNRMKTTNICNNSNVSYLDFLLKDLIKVAKFCRNENITLALETEFYKKEFPSYKFIIEKRFKRAQLLNHYMKVTTRFLSEFFGKNLTTDIADIIFSFLEVADIRNFGRALYT